MMKKTFLFAFLSLSSLLSGCFLFGGNFDVIPRGNDKYYLFGASSFLSVASLKDSWFKEARSMCREDGFSGFRFDHSSSLPSYSGLLQNGESVYSGNIECVGGSYERALDLWVNQSPEVWAKGFNKFWASVERGDYQEKDFGISGWWWFFGFVIVVAGAIYLINKGKKE